MERLRLGTSDVTVSELCLGTWAMGSRQHWGAADDDTSIAALRRALEHGVTFFDTADGYGQAETLFPRAFTADQLQQIQIATKVGWAPKDPDREMDHRRAAIVEGCEDSLRRLGRDWIDLYYIHVYDESTPAEETASGLQDLLQAGKIRAAGLSNFPLEQARAVARHVPIHAYQPAYSLVQRDFETGGHQAWCREAGITTVAFSVTCHGWLSGKFHDGAPLPTDFRGRRRTFTAEHVEATRPPMERFGQIAAGLGRSRAQVAIRWVADHADTVPLFGAKTAAQVDDNVGAAGWRLDDATRAELEDLFAS